jgi:hypothetical protein
MAIQIQVKLDTSANPPVTTIPEQTPVNNGNNTIEWTPFANQDFTFTSLTGLPNPPFSGLSVTASKISVQDDNTAAGTYAYTIVVTYNNQEYSTGSTAMRTAKASGPGTSTATRSNSILGNSTSPTIKNN